jgi:hypothetical protein
MATLAMLCEVGALVRLDPGLELGELATRRLYGTPEFVNWLDTDLPVMPEDPLTADLNPLEQVAALFHEYVTGEKFSDDRRFKKLNSTPQHHVWEFKTDDVRIFGWIPEKDVFLCCFGDSKNEIETYRKYGMYIARTKYVRDFLNLDEPKCLQEKEYKDVISTQDK